MEDLLLVALAGFIAAMVDGALGMGFGPTSSSILLSSGLSPASVSATVNLAKVATGVAAGVAHWRFRNIDRRLVLQLAISGSIGALIGVTILASVDGDKLRPILAALLLLVGIRILVRFSRDLVVVGADADDDEETLPTFNDRGVPVAGGAGGVTNGLIGAWGPVVTPFLLHKGLPPRFAIGSVNTAEVAVAAVSAGSLIASIGGEGIKASTVLAMLIGGVIAAPIAAMAVKKIPARALGVAVGGLLLLTNVRELSNWAGLGASRWAFYGIVIVAVGIAAYRPKLMRARVPATV
jgi:uncharacterized membrane protein YfcA